MRSVDPGAIGECDASIAGNGHIRHLDATEAQQRATEGGRPTHAYLRELLSAGPCSTPCRTTSRIG
jgi:hypothetical protein